MREVLRDTADVKTGAAERPVHIPAESKGEAPGRGRLAGRHVLIVGGGQMDIGESDTPIGNGRAMSVLFAREGATVAVADRNEAAAKQSVALTKSSRAFALCADVTREDDIARMVSEAHEKMDGLDAIALNVGIGANAPWLEGATVKNWNLVLSVNLVAHMLTVKYAWPKLADASSIVFISSVAGMTAGSRLPAYDASKSGLFGLCRHVAYEGARRRIRANVVAPGLMDTSIGRLATRERPNRLVTAVPLGRHGTGWETAYATLFLLSEESAYITGQTLAVDGGLSGI